MQHEVRKAEIITWHAKSMMTAIQLFCMMLVLFVARSSWEQSSCQCDQCQRYRTMSSSSHSFLNGRSLLLVGFRCGCGLGLRTGAVEIRGNPKPKRV